MKFIKVGNCIENMHEIRRIYYRTDDTNNHYKIYKVYNDGKEYTSIYDSKEDRDKDFNKLLKQTEERGKTMLDKIKKQWNNHEDVLFPLLVLWLLDYFFNDGRFQKKITNVVEGILEKVTDKFTKDTKKLEE
jgi:hypothetical protein